MKPGEHKTVQARILEYAEAIGWIVVPREEAERRKAFFKEYKEIEMLYEIISPDAFLRPFIRDNGTLAAMVVVEKAGLHSVWHGRRRR